MIQRSVILLVFTVCYWNILFKDVIELFKLKKKKNTENWIVNHESFFVSFLL